METAVKLVDVLTIIVAILIAAAFLFVMYWVNRIHNEEKWGPKGRKIAAEDTKKAELQKKKVPLYWNKDDFDTPESEPE